MKSKIGKFGFLFVEKSRSEIKRENSIGKREKLTKFCKIEIIYASKLKSNIIRRKIGKKIHN